MAPSSRKRRKQRRRAARPEPQKAAEPSPAQGYARGRAKDEAARAALVPLEPGERPPAVTVGAVVALLLGVVNLISYAAGAEIRGTRPAISGIVLFSGLMFVAAYGMWRVRYWAVLGMQALLALIVITFTLGVLLSADTVAAFAIALVVIALAGTLFWFLVKAMARIQMPERPGARS